MYVPSQMNALCYHTSILIQPVFIRVTPKTKGVIAHFIRLIAFKRGAYKPNFILKSNQNLRNVDLTKQILQ